MKGKKKGIADAFRSVDTFMKQPRPALSLRNIGKTVGGGSWNPTSPKSIGMRAVNAIGGAFGKKKTKPGELFNAHKAMAMKKKKRKSGLRPASAVVKSEQNASHQFYKKGKKKGMKCKLKHKHGKSCM